MNLLEVEKESNRSCMVKEWRKNDLREYNFQDLRFLFNKKKI